MSLKSIGRRFDKKVIRPISHFFKNKPSETSQAPATVSAPAKASRAVPPFTGFQIETTPLTISRPTAQAGTATGAPVPVLFVNFAQARCGVFQYGANLAKVLGTSRRYKVEALEVQSLEDVDKAVAGETYAAIFFNYHPQTLTFLKPDLPKRYPMPCIAVMHEMTQAEADAMSSGIFQHYVMGDPTLLETNPGVFKTGRILPRYTKTWPTPAIPTIGSLGFSVGSKGYGNVVEAVQKEFDEAIIRLHIPANDIIDADGSQARAYAEKCQQLIRKPGIRLEFSHNFMTSEEVLDFFAQNTLNAFLYDPLEVAGISSTPDAALAVRRPIAISKSIMFRHLMHIRPSICIEDTSLRQIIANGSKPFEHLLGIWSPENVLNEYEGILDRVLSNEGARFKAAPTFSPYPELNDVPVFDYQSMRRDYEGFGCAPVRMMDELRIKAAQARLKPAIASGEYHGVRSMKRLNGILDNAARVHYMPAIQDLFDLAPETMVAKIPVANVQQAFVYDSVLRYTPNGRARMLCVGSYDDSACVALKRLGFDIDEIDPAVNGLDLEKFMALPTTKLASYDVVFSTSVLEHVPGDERFMAQIADLLKPGGAAVLTCDFKDRQAADEKIIPGDHHWYTQQDLLERILPVMKGCSLVDVPQWASAEPDFQFLGYRYTFASFVVQKA